MSIDPPSFDLVAALPAAEAARLQRRVVFLEAAIVQLLRDDHRLREWFTASELAALHLPGLPRAASSIARVASRERWEHRITTGKGGERRSYHFAALPRAAFAGFIDGVLRAHATAEEAEDIPAREAAPFPVLAPATPLPAARGSEPTPQWVLPLVRLLRGGAPSVEDALRELPRRWPGRMVLPSPEEARETLAALGLLAG